MSRPAVSVPLLLSFAATVIAQQEESHKECPAKATQQQPTLLDAWRQLPSPVPSIQPIRP